MPKTPPAIEPPVEPVPDANTATATTTATTAATEPPIGSTAGTTEPPPRPGSPNGTPAASGDRFFSWLRSLGVTREPGWIGGVCAGIAARLGIDPLIVRGIVVVVAILGGPAVLLYAAAWLLLPDHANRIHLEELLRGNVEAAIAGIGAFVLIAMLPMSQGFVFGDGWGWFQSGGGSLIRVLWTLAVIGAIVWLVVWIARRAGRGPVSANSASTTVTPATTDDRPDTIPVPTGAPIPPAAPASGAPAEDIAAWREQQYRWKREHAAWREQQDATERERRDARVLAARDDAALRAAENDERRRLRRLSNPRAGGAWTIITLGAALIAGSAAALIAQSADVPVAFERAVGPGVATIMICLSVIIAALAKRRAGFLRLIGAVLVIVTIAVAATPLNRQVVGAEFTAPLYSSARYSQPVGSFWIHGYGMDPSAATIGVWQGAGSIGIDIPEGVTARINATIGDGYLETLDWSKAAGGTGEWVAESSRPKYSTDNDGARHYSVVVGSGSTHVTITIWQGTGTVTVTEPQPTTTEGVTP